MDDIDKARKLADAIERKVKSQDAAHKANPRYCPTDERLRSAVVALRQQADQISRLRAQVAEQEATIRRMQDRMSKDAETFIERVREAVEAERIEILARVGECLAGMTHDHVSQFARGKIGPAIRNRV